MIVIASKSAAHAIAVSGTVQGFGYIIAAFGPVSCGAVALMSGSWTAVKLGYFVMMGLLLVFGTFAALRITRGSAPPKS
jgi:CP family cyanate transporter-like MFS transporter